MSNALKLFYDNQESNIRTIDKQDLEYFEHLFKTKKAFNEFERMLPSRDPVMFKAGSCKMYYTDRIFSKLMEEASKFVANGCQPENRKFYHEVLNFDKDELLAILDIDEGEIIDFHF